MTEADHKLSAPPRRRVLMVAYHFPPLAGSSGIQRTLRFVQQLPRFGWDPLVLTTSTGAYERKLANLARLPLLVIDDFGLKPLHPPADEDLHDLIAERYETASTIVTSNLDFTEWDQAFPANRLLASATLDRLRHNAYCLVLDGQSYRTPKLPPTTTKAKVANTPKTTHS